MKFAATALLTSLFLSGPALAKKPDPSSLEFTKWTPEFLVPDPVAIAFDDQGRAYVTQTQRRKANDLDIRNNRDWIPDDLSFKTPDEKREFYRKQFTPENSDKNKRRVKDYNKDGKHDLEDLKALTERILLIEDTDQNGTADKISVYTEGFQDEIAGIAAGVLYHEGDVYTTIVPDVWKLRDTDNDGKADQRESIAYGFGPHLAYAGHDMHGLTVGPDGRIYWTVGDKGVGATSKEGLHFKYPNHGALLRCDPDGSNFEVYARGLRNVQEIAFDQYGNIFGVDNDSDRPGEKERFVYIVQHMDAGWRSNWQYRGSDFNPWMDENLSVPYQKGQPAHIVPPIRLYNNGPAGMAFNPGTALSEEWKDYFFHTSAPNGQQWAFQVEQDGATYKMINDMQIGNGVPIVGINFGPNGALYGVDWGGGYPLNKKGAVWKWDTKEKHPLRKQTAAILKASPAIYDNRDLVTHLNHPDQRVRLKAQFELVKRGAREELIQASKEGPQLSRIHTIWGICQLDRKTRNTKGEILELLSDPDPEIRVQVLKTYSENFGVKLALHQAPEPSEAPFAFEAIENCLKDDSDRVKYFAAMALGNFGASGSEKALVEMARAIDDQSKTYLRHAIIVGLTGCAPTDFLAKLASDKSEFVQTVAVVALRRRGDSAVSAFLQSPFEFVAAEASRAIHDDWTIPDAMPKLAGALDSTQWISNESFIRRSLNANFHLGSDKSAARVANFAARPDALEALRLEALDALSEWTKPEKLDRVIGRYRPLADRDVTVAKAALESQLVKLLTLSSEKIQGATMALARTLKIEISTEALVAVASNANSLPDLRVEALKALASQNTGNLKEILKKALDSSSTEVRIAALELISKIDRPAATTFISSLLEKKGAPLKEQQAAVKLLVNSGSDEILKKLIETFDQVPLGLKLDLAEAAAARNLKAPAPDFSHTIEGGDASLGEKIFMNHISAQCIRCHKVDDGKGSDLGPNLKSIGLKERAHLLESLLEPQKAISDGYGSISLTLKNGDSVAGILGKETKDILEIRDPEGKKTKVKASDIKERSPVISTMPPMGQILKKREIRDVIEYLSTLKKKPKK
ncbi:MAG: PVC-type heme-binding CxxCH protein [Akkermansiaceae bacterium]